MQTLEDAVVGAHERYFPVHFKRRLHGRQRLRVRYATTELAHFASAHTYVGAL